jgi:hypothetical protein
MAPLCFSRTLAALAAIFALAFLSPRLLHAQDPDIIRGRVTGPDSLPIEGASVSVTAIQSGVNKTARTDKGGRFTVTFPSAEGDYWVYVQFIGLLARRFEIKRLADEDVLIADVRLQKPMTILGPVRVQGQRPTVGPAVAADVVGAVSGQSIRSLAEDDHLGRRGQKLNQ